MIILMSESKKIKKTGKQIKVRIRHVKVVEGKTTEDKWGRRKRNMTMEDEKEEDNKGEKKQKDEKKREKRER